MLPQPRMSILGYRLFDALEKPGNIIGLIERVDNDVNVLWHNDKSEQGIFLSFASILNRLYEPAPGAIS